MDRKDLQGWVILEKQNQYELINVIKNKFQLQHEVSVVTYIYSNFERK